MTETETRDQFGEGVHLSPKLCVRDIAEIRLCFQMTPPRDHPVYDVSRVRTDHDPMPGQIFRNDPSQGLEHGLQLCGVVCLRGRHVSMSVDVLPVLLHHDERPAPVPLLGARLFARVVLAGAIGIDDKGLVARRLHSVKPSSSIFLTCSPTTAMISA